MRKGRILLTGFLLGSLLLNGCSRNSSLQVVVPKKEQESVLLNQGDESSVQEQVQAPVRYLCDKDSAISACWPRAGHCAGGGRNPAEKDQKPEFFQ